MSQSVPGGMVVGTFIHVLSVLSSNIGLETCKRLCGFTHSIQLNDWENILKSAVITSFLSLTDSSFIAVIQYYFIYSASKFFLNKPRNNI